MAQTVKLALSTLLGMLGWHGVFLLFLIVSFKLFLAEQDSTVCPCAWNVTYSTLMFVIPSLTSYVIAVFAYFRQDDDSVPWKALRGLYVFKAACHLYDERTHWDFHAEHCNSCKQLNRDWSLVKIGVSAVFSLLYPAVWLSLSFLQAYYYVCANVGPTRSSLTNYCDVQIKDLPKDYDKEHGLAVIRSKVIGGVLFISALFCLGVFVIIYGEIEHFLKKVDFCSNYNSSHLQVDISILPRRSPGTIDSAGSLGNQVPSVIRVQEVPDARSQVSILILVLLFSYIGKTFDHTLWVGSKKGRNFLLFHASWKLFSNCHNGDKKAFLKNAVNKKCPRVGGGLLKAGQFTRQLPPTG